MSCAASDVYLSSKGDLEGNPSGDGQEGGYQGAHWDSQELLEHIGVDLANDDGRLFDILAECLGDEVWCQRDPHSLRRDERLIGSWEDFCRSIKHERRYFFLQQKKKRFDSEYLSPSDLLRFISRTVNQHELLRKLPTGSPIYRARHQKPGEVLRTPYDFGPPPVERAKRPNRMSPAGIVMFDANDDHDTAVVEIDDDPSLGIAVGTFRTTRDAIVLDLTKLPKRLGFFEQQSDSSEVDRYALEFLHRFVKSLAAKVAPRTTRACRLRTNSRCYGVVPHCIPLSQKANRRHSLHECAACGRQIAGAFCRPP
jgi:HEPN/RES N-terminal domain 1